MPTYTPDSSGWSANQYNNTASFVYSSDYTTPIISMLQPRPGERILDLGCGSGELSIKLAAIVKQAEGGVVVGVDASESMVNKAKENGLEDVFVCDAQDLQLPESVVGTGFDAVFSSATLHWCKRDPAGVLAGVKRLLKPEGRFVAEMGGYMNCVGVRSALHQVLLKREYDPKALDPWYFPSVEEYSHLLIKAGFNVKDISLNPRLTPVPAGLYAWLQLFARNSFLRGATDAEAEEVLREVESICEVDCKTSDGSWAIMYMRLRFTAILYA